MSLDLLELLDGQLAAFTAPGGGDREHMSWEFPWYTLRDDFHADHDVMFLRAADGVAT